jgi:RNA-directed DNA polymerase
MPGWRPQLYESQGKAKGINAETLKAAKAAGDAIIAVNPSLPPIFTLRHLAYLTDSEYGLLRKIVTRHISDPYRVFRMRKRPDTTGKRRFRIICAPDPTLLMVQRWLAKNVLAHATSKIHPASTAYAPGSKIIEAARPHCGCRWLIKLDIKNFFESITEMGAYRAYRSLGYQRLIAFELARLSTRLGSHIARRVRGRWLRYYSSRHNVIDSYVHHRMGHLPQGAPTSPMLANMAMLRADKELALLAQKHGLIYPRYADDTFSTSDKLFHRESAAEVIRGVYTIIGRFGLSPNATKTHVVPPRGRKVVLGLLVDQNIPRLTRTFKAALRMHLHYLEHPDVGPAKHAQKRGFTAVAGLRNHLLGLAAFAAQIEPAYGAQVGRRLASVSWPILG